MAELISRQGPVISTRLLNKLVAFYAPKTFSNDSTQFDTGYEQCKRDLREILLKSVPGLDEIDRWGAVHTPEYNISVENNPVERDSVWARIFGKQN